MYNESAKYEKEISANDFADKNTDIVFIVVSKENVKRLEEFILKMDLKYQEIIFLKSMTDFSLKQIAEMLNIKPETARKRFERGKAKIKEFLAKENP